MYNDESVISPDDYHFIFIIFSKVRSKIHYEGHLNPASVLVMI